ncbi:MAG: hypothetical protein M3139_01500 [Bacteroidota bacterium]|nr:hypothetical protein [Bacteroidota bacterium]
MKFCFPFILCAMLFNSSAAQPSDILLLKKNSRTIKTFFPGNQISFNTSTGFFSGLIQSIQKDSLFLVQYDIKRIPTNLGFYFLDTVGTYPFSINYKQITSFGKNKNNFDLSASGGALFGGGVLLTTVGLGTWLFTKPKSQYYASPYLVGGAAFLALVGYLLVKSGSRGLVIGKKYSLEYIRVK